MAYIKTYDERSYGTYVNSSSGDRDAPGSLNSNYTLAAGESAYGTLTYNNLADIDVYSLGSLSAGSYLLDVNAYTWDFSNVGYGGISSFQLLNSYGGIVETSYSTASDIEFTVNSTSTYYVKVVGNYYDDQQYSATYSRNDDITPVGDVTAPTLSAVYINGTEFAEGDTVVGSITAFDTSGIAYADIQYLFPTGDYDYLELTDPDGDGTFTASDLIDATVPEGSYLAKSIYIQDASTNQNYVEYRYDGSVYINDTLQSTNHTFDFSKLDFDIVDDDITPVGDVTAPTLSAVYINGTEFAEGDTVVGSITAFDTSGIAYADIQYLFPTGDYDYLELTDPDGDGTFTASDLIDATVPEGSYLAKNIYIQDASTNQNYVEYRYDGSVYINDTLQSTNHTFDFSKLDFDIVDDDTPPSLPAFDIRMTSSDNGTASFAIYANELVDPDGDGIGAFEFTLSHDPSDLLVDVGSIAAASGFFGVPNYNATTGVLELGGIKEPSFNDLSTPIATFEATTLDTANPLTLTISNAFVDGVAQDDVVDTFNFSSVSITATTVDRFGDDLVLLNDDVFAFEISGGDQLFVREGDSSDTNTVVEIVANPTSEFSALDFDLTDYAGLTDFTLSDALSNWTVQTNTTVADQVSFSGFSNSAEIPAGQETVLATFTTAIDPDFDISGIKLDGAAEPDVAVGEIPAASTNGNVTVFEVSSGTGAFVNAYKSIDAASEDAIGAYDALQALRLAVGLTKSDGTAEWHDYLAADINKDGRVGADDALDILKYAVGLTDGSSADWIFVDGDADWSRIDRRNTDYDEGVMLEDVLVDTSINMIGILVGDLDGSYVA